MPPRSDRSCERLGKVLNETMDRVDPPEANSRSWLDSSFMEREFYSIRVAACLKESVLVADALADDDDVSWNAEE